MNLTLSLPLAQTHAESYGFLLFVLPALSFLLIKIWFISRDDAKAERTSQWFLPQNMESDATRLVFNYSRRSVVFVHETVSEAVQPSESVTTDRASEAVPTR